MEKDAKGEAKEISDWEVTVSKELEVTGTRQMGMDMSKTRLRPVFLSSGELLIIIPAASEKEAGEKARKIAKQIAAAEIWGMDLLDLSNFRVE